MVLLALFGAVMGQGVIWYTGQFYAQNFLETTCRIEFEQSRTIMLWAIAFATPFFLLFGWLSDKIGRKWIMMFGMLLGILTYRPIFNTFLQDTASIEWQKINSADMSPVVRKTEAIKNSSDSLVTSTALFSIHDGRKFTVVTTDTLSNTTGAMTGSGTTVVRDKHLSPFLYWKFVGLVFLLILYVTMVYGPIAAFLVEMFPTRIRYTSMSLPYHIGNGVFGGLVPFIGLLLTTTYTDDPLVGLWYPIAIAALCLVIGSIYLSNKIDRDIND